MFNREKIRTSLSKSIKQNKPIIGVAVGSGLSAKQAYKGGADLIFALNAGKFRNSGVASLGCMMPYANSNEMVMEFGSKEILPRITDKPVIFGACASDPIYPHDELLNRITKLGFHGVNNFPTVGLIDGVFREALEEKGLGFDCEVELMRKAVAKNLFTVAFVFNKKQAVKMAEQHVDVICLHLGWTVGGEKGVKQRTKLDDCVKYADKVFDVVNNINPNIFNMIYGGGPIKSPEQANIFFKNTKAVGYIGGSIFERIPTEISIKETTNRFKNFYRLKKENKKLKRELIRKKGFDEIVGQSRAMQEMYEIISKVADKNVNVLVSGESGTGKELVVRAIHYNSSRYNNPFIKVNCAAIPENLLESELFGHERGAFTGAVQKRLGRFELAHKGTLFLDEISEISLNNQAKLLRAIQEQEFERVGGNKTIKTDVRIISATNRDLRKAVQEGRFREDLYYRLNVVSINVPPLRERKEDIPLLVNHFIKKINSKFNRSIRKLTPAAIDSLYEYDWPGNVRELEHVLERAAVLCDGDVISIKDLPIHLQNCVEVNEISVKGNLEMVKRKTDHLEKRLIIETLRKHSWNRTKTARELGINRRTLYNKIKKYNIKP